MSQCEPLAAAREPARVMTRGEGIGAMISSIAAPTETKIGRGTVWEMVWRYSIIGANKDDMRASIHEWKTLRNWHPDWEFG